jgi:hypothetical protein
MRVENCQVCRGRQLHLVLDLGCTALANAFVRPSERTRPELKFPLRLVYCGECGLIQIDEHVRPETLFKNYIYVSGTSDLVHAHAASLASRLIIPNGLGAGDLVVEAASNDGTVLKALQKHGVRTLGIDPAENIALRATRAGVETRCAYFNRRSAAEIRADYGTAKLVLARHVLAHVADLDGFVQGFVELLDRDGLGVIEVPYLRRFHDKLAFDTIYHEHLCYFSLRVLDTLFQRFSLEVIDAWEVAIHGGSIVVTVQRRGGLRTPTPRVRQLLDQEELAGLHRLETWHAFADRVAASKSRLLAVLDRLRTQGRAVAGYGAPAKGMTMLAYCGIVPEQVPYLVDKSPFKQGLLTPGHHIPVHAPEKISQDRPDVLLLLAWNFADEIVKQQADFQRRGGRFLLPLPLAHYWKETTLAA